MILRYDALDIEAGGVYVILNRGKCVASNFHVTATNAIDKVHSMGNMPAVPVMLEPANKNPNIFGTTILSPNGNILQVKIFENSPAKAITELHEIGHCLDSILTL